MITRELQAVIEQKLFKGKVIVLTGPRQAGKTTLLKQVIEKQPQPALTLNCDEPEVRTLLSGANLQELRMLAGNYKIIVVDEAQRVKNIGLTLKLLADAFPAVQLLVTGSSSLELAGEVNEPLTGRKFSYYLYPFSAKELATAANTLAEKQSLETRLIYGAYPDVINFPGEAKECLLNLSDSYLYKDILALGDVRKPAQLEKLLVALALQLGREISYHELAQTIGATADTVERYIDLLEKCFVVFQRQAFSRNHRNEIKKGKKIYFYDNGIRNAIVQNFSPLNLRPDSGFLWENYFVSERMKANHYRRYFVKNYFWRTFQQQEIDLIEEADGLLSAFEIKWNEKRRPKIPAAFAITYPQHVFHVVNSDNYMEYLM
ncbi:MAG: ATP-binding protein [Prevotellaceae bacterium]|jgi:predicted AAA+ superfamily ATPase|nr:ATP-binding protein [Prevotellaceae bacterium]